MKKNSVFSDPYKERSITCVAGAISCGGAFILANALAGTRGNVATPPIGCSPTHESRQLHRLSEVENCRGCFIPIRKPGVYSIKFENQEDTALKTWNEALEQLRNDLISGSNSQQQKTEVTKNVLLWPKIRSFLEETGERKEKEYFGKHL